MSPQLQVVTSESIDPKILARLIDLGLVRRFSGKWDWSPIDEIVISTDVEDMLGALIASIDGVLLKLWVRITGEIKYLVMEGALASRATSTYIPMPFPRYSVAFVDKSMPELPVARGTMIGRIWRPGLSGSVIAWFTTLDAMGLLMDAGPDSAAELYGRVAGAFRVSPTGGDFHVA